MLAEALAYLGAAGGGLYIDATLGLGGHTEAILQASPLARVIGLDRDGEAIEKAGERLAGYGERFEAIHTDYRRIKQALIEREVGAVAGVLADLGVSSLQLDLPERGFSFRQSGPLDMRMDRRGGGATAAELINELGERELSDLIHEYGEERAARRIARRVIEEWHRSWCGRRRRAGAGGFIRRRGPFRRCGSRSTASSTGLPSSSVMRSTCSRRAGGW
jgi:16S rRNA (cytosine1402-N4)-methyltransferase